MKDLQEPQPQPEPPLVEPVVPDEEGGKKDDKNNAEKDDTENDKDAKKNDEQDDKKNDEQNDKKDSDKGCKTEPSEPRAAEKPAPQGQELVGQVLSADEETTRNLLEQAATVHKESCILKIFHMSLRSYNV